jgi:hypothetical protein
MIWTTDASSTSVSILPLLIVTEDCKKFESPKCTVAPLLPLLLGVDELLLGELLLDELEELPEVLAVLVPGRWQAASRKLPRARTMSEIIRRCPLLRFIALLTSLVLTTPEPSLATAMEHALVLWYSVSPRRGINK